MQKRSGGWEGGRERKERLQMITVVSVGEHLHILQNLDQRLYLLSFLEIVQPDYQLLQSFLVLLLAPLTAATGHDGPCAQQASPPAPRPAAPGRCSQAAAPGRAQLTAGSPSAPHAPCAPTPACLCRGRRLPTQLALPSLSLLLLLPPPPPRPQKGAQWPARGSPRLGAQRNRGEQRRHGLSWGPAWVTLPVTPSRAKADRIPVAGAQRGPESR